MSIGREFIEWNRERYLRSGKAKKGEILSDFCESPQARHQAFGSPLCWQTCGKSQGAEGRIPLRESGA